MTLTQLRYLVAISDAGLNITLAAERVHATQPGLSKQLKQLEDELGFQLFSRKGKSLQRDHAGRPCKSSSARASSWPKRATCTRSRPNIRGDEEGELTIATTHTQARFVLPPAIGALKHRYPGDRRASAAAGRRAGDGAVRARPGRSRDHQHEPARRPTKVSRCRCSAGDAASSCRAAIR